MFNDDDDDDDDDDDNDNDNDDDALPVVVAVPGTLPRHVPYIYIHIYIYTHLLIELDEPFISWQSMEIARSSLGRVMKFDAGSSLGTIRSHRFFHQFFVSWLILFDV